MYMKSYIILLLNLLNLASGILILKNEKNLENFNDPSYATIENLDLRKVCIIMTIDYVDFTQAFSILADFRR